MNPDELLARPLSSGRAVRKRKFAKYPSCFGSLRIGALCRVARENGMEIIEAVKPGMHTHNEIGLYGTAEQMRKTEKQWTAAGNEAKPRSFRAVFGVNLNRPRDQWGLRASDAP